MSDETAALLRGIPGGAALLNWSENARDCVFGDGEVVSLNLYRDQPSTLVIDIFRLSTAQEWERLRVTFVLGAWIDTSLRGFSGQNVIGELIFAARGRKVNRPLGIRRRM